jgi:hypothetical protein
VEEIETLKAEIEQLKACIATLGADHNRYVNTVAKVVGFETCVKIQQLIEVEDCEGEA